LALSPESSTGTQAPSETRFRTSCAFRNDTPRRTSTRASSTGRAISFATSTTLMVWEAEDFWRSPGVFPGRPSASFNDNLVDICFLQTLASDGIEASPPERAAIQAVDMSSANMEHPAPSGHFADDLHQADRRRDLDDHDLAIDQADLDRYGGAVPHIRESRSDNKGSKAGWPGCPTRHPRQ